MRGRELRGRRPLPARGRRGAARNRAFPVLPTRNARWYLKLRRPRSCVPCESFNWRRRERTSVWNDTMRTLSDMLAFAVTDGMLHFELTATYEIFTAPQLDYDVKVCGNGPVRVGRFTLEPDLPLDQLGRADTVIVPAIADVDEPIDLELVQAVRAAHDAGARIVSL